MEHRRDDYGAAGPLTRPAEELSPEDELRLAFGRAIGFTLAAIVLLVGGGILVFIIAGTFFGFLFGS